MEPCRTGLNLFIILLFCTNSISAFINPSQKRSLASTWNTLNGSAPLVIAHGGSSGMFPDQTAPAFLFAVNNSLAGSAVFCDLQLTKDGYSICRSGIDLGASTTVNLTFPNMVNTYNVNGESVSGFFSIDFTIDQVLSNLTATQSNPERSPYYDGIYPILQPYDVSYYLNNTGALIWINVEYAEFYNEHKLNVSEYILSYLLPNMPVDYLSSPEVAFLKTIKKEAKNSSISLMLRFRDTNEIEPSTNQTYGTILKDLKSVATYASGILVPKTFIWPVDNSTGYLESETSLIGQAHAAGLAVFASDFVNDASTPIYNYSFDPVREYLQYVPSSGSNVDGFVTDFPSTASEAIACFRGSSLVKNSSNPVIISHNGASGDFPGCTQLAYEGAVNDGATYIDCPVQMSKDGVPFCSESPNLLNATDVSLNTNFFPRLDSTIPQLGSGSGLYSFNLTWEQISTLKARIYSPESSYNLDRNPAYMNEAILSLSDFLSYGKTAGVGMLIDIQNGYFLEKDIGLDVVDAVLSGLSSAGLNNSEKVLIQSEDYAVLQRLRSTTKFKLAYRVVSENVVIDKAQVVQMKGVADYATLPRGLVQKAASIGYLLSSSENLVDLFHEENMTMFVSYFRNEFVTLPFDYDSDPSLELNTMVQYFKVDGIVTDFPQTTSYYLGNKCLNMKMEATEFHNYQMRLVVPGVLVNSTTMNVKVTAPPPGALLNVTEGETALPPTTFGPSHSPNTTNSPAPSPSPSGSGSAAWSFPISLTFTTSIFLYFIII